MQQALVSAKSDQGTHLDKGLMAARALAGARRQWNEIRLDVSGYPLSCRELSHRLLSEGLYDEAETILTDGVSRFPGDIDLALRHALVAQNRRDWTSALTRWEGVR